ncbi:Zn-ribbon domain-containing OB-fold protein [Nocardia sp. NBC_00565]|uniref:Zn-ribbon domain-containing OB-fold protein n=1 Tax=Nocardia sp. NBC_00565 TaxID=2975993 RepID=UPI002E80418B|nr:Zn-ribbon domain-containing OB-fold protein [Nocardia sp. NBC_00565]WUC05683.1 Zn-ribbon domain-containing OB-fold protein [Nocardia sp. NBC_00565]
MSKNRADVPVVEGISRQYWDAAREGRLLIAQCADCGRVHHYPRVLCPFCWSEAVSPIEATGTGAVYSYSTVYVNDLEPFKSRLPYVAAVVELDEGPRVVTNIDGIEPDQVRVGMPVRAAFREIVDQTYAVVFTPIES